MDIEMEMERIVVKEHAMKLHQLSEQINILDVQFEKSDSCISSSNIIGQHKNKNK